MAKNNKTPNTIANTITAAKAPNIVAEIAAPINNPSTNAKSIVNITASTAKQLVFLSFLLFSQ